MNRTWMYGDRRDKAFQKGITEFRNAALEHQAAEERRLEYKPLICCPCRDCSNVKRWADIDFIENHLYRRGFKADYEVWYWHGEELAFGDDDDNNNDVQLGENPYEVNDTIEDGNDVIEENETNDMMDAFGDHLNDKPRMFEDLSNAAETPLYPGCTKYTKLSAVLIFSNLQAKHGLSDVGLSDFLEAFEDMLHPENVLPKSAYYAKKLINPLGLGYTKIDACPNDCVLYRKEYENLDACPKCNLSRYKKVEGDSRSNKKLPPTKVLWYLPIIPRFRRLFSIPGDAKNLVWHHEGRKKDGLIRHPADSKQWDDINKEFPVFRDEHKNLRLGLSADGMNPYGTLSTQHSSWPVLLTIYNLAYKSYRARIKENTKMVLEVKRIECAQQTGGLDCGYYVMKYMNEIVKKVGESKGDVKQIRDYIRRSAPYTKGELDEVREQWARFFRLNFLLSDPN